MSFLFTPHLPENRVTAMAVSNQFPHLVQQLSQIGITPVLVPPSTALDQPVASHPDMLLHPLGENKLIYAHDSQPLRDTLRELGFLLMKPAHVLEKNYPKDVGLNALSLGNYLFGKDTALDPVLLQSWTERGKELISVRQGYAKCSCCAVDQTHVICSDTGIAKAMEKVGISVLVVETKGILLEGYSCGFIGGCAGKLAPDEICFTGSLSCHPQGEEIKAFLKGCGVLWRELTSGPLLDVGSLIPLLEDG